jgi:hypothetical protein
MAKNSLPRKCREGPSITTQESKGFEIILHDAKHIVRIRTWGCWDRELAKTYGNALGEKLDEIRGLLIVAMAQQQPNDCLVENSLTCLTGW